MKNALIKIVKHSSVYGIGNFATKAIAFFLIPLYTSYLTPADYGVLQICNVTNSLLTIILLLGMNSSLFRVYFNTDNLENRKTIFSSTYAVYFAFSAIIIVPLLFFANPLSRLIIGNHGSQYLLTIVILSAFFEGIYNLELAYLRAEEKPVIFVISSIIKIIFYVLMNILFVVHLKRNYVGVREVNLMSILLIVIISLPIILKGINFKVSFAYIKDVVKIGVPLGIGAIAIWVLTLTDRFMLKVLLPESIAMTQVGLYSLGAKFSMLIKMLLVSPFMLSWGTLMFSYQNNPNAKELYKKVLNYFVFVAGFVFLIFTIFAKDIIMLVAQNAEYYDAYKIVPLLSFSMILHGFYTVISVGVILTKKTKYVIISNYSAAILNIILNFLLIPKYGMLGAAIASVIAFILNSVILYNFAQKCYFIKYKIINVIVHFAVLLIIIGISYYLDLSALVKVLVVIIAFAIMPLTSLVGYKDIRKISKLVYRKLRFK